MRYFYTVPTNLLDANRPRALFHAVQMPDDRVTTLMVVEQWADTPSQDEWEALPGVVEHPLWEWGTPVHPRLLGGFARAGVLPSHSMGDAMRLIRKYWPAARH